jgi:hypothetical protein
MVAELGWATMSRKDVTGIGYPKILTLILKEIGARNGVNCYVLF